MYKELLWHLEMLDILGEELYGYYIDNLVELEEENEYTRNYKTTIV